MNENKASNHEDYDLSSAIEGEFLKESRKGRKAYIWYFLAMIAVDLLRYFWVGYESTSTAAVILIIIYLILAVLFFVNFIKVLSVAIEIPSWVFIAVIVILMVIRIPFLPLGIILALDLYIHIKQERLTKKLKKAGKDTKL
jgi:hypothetical protein